jgi:hypothetical protein
MEKDKSITYVKIWENAVMRARFGKKVPRHMLKNFSIICEKIFLEKIKNFEYNFSPEKQE